MEESSILIKYSNPSIYVAVDSKKRRHKSKRRKSNLVLLTLQSSMFLTRNLKKLYEVIPVIPRYMSQLASKKAMQIQVRGEKKFDDVNRNNVNRDTVLK